MVRVNGDRAAAVELLEGNLWSLWSVFGRGPGGTLIETPEVMAFQTPMVEMPYNGVMRFRHEGEDVDARITELLDPYRVRGVPAFWVVHPTCQPSDLRDHLGRHGLEPAEVVTGMVAEVAGFAAPSGTVPGIEIIELTSDDDPKPWLELVSWRYHIGPQALGHLGQLYRATEVGPRSDIRVWIARHGDRPVAKVILHVGAGAAGIYGVVTLPETRGLGLASRLTLIALDAARARGCATAVLHSTPMAVDLYRRLGFVSVADFEVWAEPGTLHL